MWVGDAQLSAVMEINALAFPATRLMPAADPAEIAARLDWLAPDHYDPQTGSALLSHHTWLIDTGRHKILVDPCVGNGKTRQVFAFYHMLDTPWLERLAAAGARPEEIDYVFCTHLHVDHCGWNTRLVDGRWVPTFPNARYVFSAAERDFWGRELKGLPLDESDRFNTGVFADSVQPVIDAGQALIVSGGLELAGCLEIIETPGHTPGHLGALFDAGSDGVVFAGDALHHPLQVLFPTWNTSTPPQPQAAVASRRRLLGLAADRQWLLAPAHFRGAHACRVTPGRATEFDIRWSAP